MVILQYLSIFCVPLTRKELSTNLCILFITQIQPLDIRNYIVMRLIDMIFLCVHYYIVQFTVYYRQTDFDVFRMYAYNTDALPCALIRYNSLGTF